MASDVSREDNVYMAKLAEQAERYEEMVEFMEKVAKMADAEELTVEERNLLSVAYKNVIGARRASWRIISSIEQKEKSRGNEDHVSIIKEYMSKIETEFSKICDGILNLHFTILFCMYVSFDEIKRLLRFKGFAVTLTYIPITSSCSLVTLATTYESQSETQTGP
ncbi:hypothetical protein RND81_04G059500 [Saponaria officinalis]|uniref:14-3-3 domain-containing protein n=1 Tax=Saponaria officinalis TaxID=3572 RepID=A0AAW1LII3_SAPOF